MTPSPVDCQAPTVRFAAVTADVDPQEFALIHGWMQQPEIDRWWSYGGPPSLLRNLLFDDPESAHVRSWLASDTQGPFGFVQTYRVIDDPLAEHYDVHPHDRGWHVLVGPEERIGDRTGSGRALARDLLCGVFAEPDVERVVCEPDELNERMLAFCRALGGREIGRFPFDDKESVLMAWERSVVADRWPRALAAAEQAHRRWDALDGASA